MSGVAREVRKDKAVEPSVGEILIKVCSSFTETPPSQKNRTQQNFLVVPNNGL